MHYLRGHCSGVWTIDITATTSQQFSLFCRQQRQVHQSEIAENEHRVSFFVLFCFLRRGVGLRGGRFRLPCAFVGQVISWRFLVAAVVNTKTGPCSGGKATAATVRHGLSAALHFSPLAARARPPPVKHRVKLEM